MSRQCGNASVYCPTGSADPLAVGAGYVSTGGDEFTRMDRVSCPATDGSGDSMYCPGDGYSHVCPAGVYGSTGGLSSDVCSGPCDAGYYCPEGSVMSNASVCGAVDK